VALRHGTCKSHHTGRNGGQLDISTEARVLGTGLRRWLLALLIGSCMTLVQSAGCRLLAKQECAVPVSVLQPVMPCVGGGLAARSTVHAAEGRSCGRCCEWVGTHACGLTEIPVLSMRCRWEGGLRRPALDRTGHLRCSCAAAARSTSVAGVVSGLPSSTQALSEWPTQQHHCSELGGAVGQACVRQVVSPTRGSMCPRCAWLESACFQSEGSHDPHAPTMHACLGAPFVSTTVERTLPLLLQLLLLLLCLWPRRYAR
jgi:hypothetical protein